MLVLLADRSLLAPAPSAKIFLTLGVNALSNKLRKIRPGITVYGMPSGFRDWVSDRTSHGREVAEAALVPFYPGHAKIILHTVRGGDAASRRTFFRRPPKQKGLGSAGPLSLQLLEDYWPKRLLNMTFTRPRITSDEASSSS